MQKFNVSRPTIYKTLKLSHHKLFRPLLSTNERLKRQAKRYNKNYPDEMFHVDTKRLPFLKGETKLSRREYFFAGKDDYSCELYAEIYDDKSQFSATMFLQNDVLAQVPYTIECVYSENEREYQGTAEHAFVKLCLQNHINQKLTKPVRPQTNGKAERAISTLMEMRHERKTFIISSDRQVKLRWFINFYNTIKPHKGLNGATSYEILEFYIKQKV